MALAVQCPGCRSRLGVLESAIGTKVECPKCHKMVQVPGGEGEEFEVVDEDIEVVDDDFEVVEEDDFEVVDDAPKKAPKKEGASRNGKPKKKARVVVADDDDEEEDEDYDERPKKKKKFKKKPPQKSNMPLLIVGGLVALLVVGGGLVFALKGGGSKKNTDPAKTDWVQFSPPDNSFTASFPGGSPSSTDLFSLIDPKSGNSAAQKQRLTQAGVIIDGWMLEKNDRKYIVGRMQFPPQIAAVLSPQMMMNLMDQQFQGGTSSSGETIESNSTATVSGQSAKRVVAKRKEGSAERRSILYMFAVNSGLYMIIVDGADLDANDAMVTAFAEKFQLNQSATPAPGPAPAPGPGRGRGRTPGGR